MLLFICSGFSFASASAPKPSPALLPAPAVLWGSAGFRQEAFAWSRSQLQSQSTGDAAGPPSLWERSWNQTASGISYFGLPGTVFWDTSGNCSAYMSSGHGPAPVFSGCFGIWDLVSRRVFRCKFKTKPSFWGTDGVVLKWEATPWKMPRVFELLSEFFSLGYVLKLTYSW